jgi:hypothetical protein
VKLNEETTRKFIFSRAVNAPVTAILTAQLLRAITHVAEKGSNHEQYASGEHPLLQSQTKGRDVNEYHTHYGSADNTKDEI